MLAANTFLNERSGGHVLACMTQVECKLTKKPGLIPLGERCCLQRIDGDEYFLNMGGSPVLRFSMVNRLEVKLVAAMVVDAKAAAVKTVLRIFQLDDATLWRARQRLHRFGVNGLLPERRGPKGPFKLKPGVVRQIVKLAEQGRSLRGIRDAVGLSICSIADALAKAGFERRKPTTEAKQAELPLSTPETLDPVVEDESRTEFEIDVEPRQENNLASKRLASSQTMAWLLAMIGMSPDGEAEVVFEARRQVRHAGVLLAIPVLHATGLFDAMRGAYGRLRKGIYGLRATVLVLAVLAFLRRSRPEALKGLDPEGLGDALGLLRVPEVKTMRRKLAEIAQAGKAHELLNLLGTRWLHEGRDDLGVLYVDGHVRVYHGKHTLPKAHVAQRNMSMPATTDYWVNGVDGEPVFVVTAQANAGLTQVLPGLLKQIVELGGRKGTVVFDRGGWSPKLFKQLIEGGWHILTYRKGKTTKHPLGGFRHQEDEIDGRTVSYCLSEKKVRLKKGPRLREIAELRDDGGQTILLTSHWEHSAVLLAHRMFERWRQENYFRYMLENFDLDALVEYEVEADDPNREIPNPERKRLERTIVAARTELAELERAYGAAAANNTEAKRPTMRGFKIAHGETGKALRAARAKVARLVARRSRVPKRVPVGEVLGAEQVVRLRQEAKLFTDAIKAAVYRAESALLSLLRGHFKRADDEGRAFLREAVRQPADIEVAGDQVTVRLGHMSAPRFTRSLEDLCAQLNALAPCFPETAYRLRFEAEAHPEAA